MYVTMYVTPGDYKIKLCNFYLFLHKKEILSYILPIT